MDSDNSNKTNGTDINHDVDQDEEFKMLIVKKVARAIKKNMPIKIFLEKLQSNLGKDCKKLWTQMVTATTKKLRNLRENNDLLKQSDTTMQLSATEWLLFDLVLVHEKINVAYNKNVPQCLNELYKLIQRHDVENLTGDKLAKQWIRLTLEYNKGGRMVSPMLLQQRWYQLKELARKQVFEEDEGLGEDTINILHSIAIKHQKIITQPYPAWQLLIKQKRVILSEQFAEILKQVKWKLDAPELWYLETNKDFYDSLSNKIGKSNKNVTNSIPITVHSDNTIDELSCKESNGSLSIDLAEDQRDNDILKQVTSKKIEQYLDDTPNTDLPKDQPGNVKKCQPKTKPKSKDKSLLLDIDDEVDNILKEKSEVMNGLSKNIIGNTTDDIQDKMDKDVPFGEKSMREVTKKGIVKRKSYLIVEKTDYVNKDIESIDANKRKKKKNPSNTGVKYDNAGHTKKYHIDDSKLRTKPIVSTRKLDAMKVFKHIVYDIVRDKKVIESALLESKLPLEHVSTDKHDGVAQDISLDGKIQIEEEIKQNTNETTNTVLKSTSWLFRKPIRRKYFTKQFQTNPDFNTELKKLTPEFLSSNEILLEKCVPLTVDVHKDFENKLINGRITIKDINKFKSANATVTQKIYNVGMETQVFEVSDTNISKDIVKNKHDPQKYSTLVGQRTSACERSKIINLPNVDQICDINQSLLSAEGTPILNDPLNKQSEINQLTVIQSTKETPPDQAQKEQLNDMDILKI